MTPGRRPHALPKSRGAIHTLNGNRPAVLSQLCGPHILCPKATVLHSSHSQKVNYRKLKTTFFRTQAPCRGSAATPAPTICDLVGKQGSRDEETTPDTSSLDKNIVLTLYFNKRHLITPLG